MRILINGAKGKMGQVTAATLRAQTDFNIVGETEHNDDLAATIKSTQPDIVIDFTNAASVLKNAEIIIEAKVHPVIGTTGLLAKQVTQLQKRAAAFKLGGIIAPNFSLGAVLMMKSAQEIAKYFPEIEIIEMHHNGKLDSPSGTAVRTAEMLANSRAKKPETLTTTREVVKGARGANYQDIPIHAIRLPGLVAHQQVLFGGTGETLTIRHDAIDRLCFMPGVILACKKVRELSELVYGLEHLI